MGYTEKLPIADAASNEGSEETSDQVSFKISDALNPFSKTLQSRSQPYLTGLRGLLVIQSFLWLFMHTFVPGAESETEHHTAIWQRALRDILSVIFWNGTLIYSFFIILSARTLCLPFLQDPTGATLAKNLIGRHIRLGVPLYVGGAIAIVTLANIDTSYFDQFVSLVPSAAEAFPGSPKTSLAGFLSVYNTLWVTRAFADQALNAYWPSHSFWVPSLIYSQSWTVYTCMLVLPWTRPGWHWQGLLAFSAGAFWFNSWGWYSATGLFFADISLVPELKIWIRNIFAVKDGIHIPTWIASVIFIMAGLVQKYLWTAIFPQYIDKELCLHPTFETSETTVSDIRTGTYARIDDWLIVCGVFLLIELFEPLQKVLSKSPLMYLGNRSLSFFIVQCILFYTIGIKIFLALVSTAGLSISAATGVIFLIMMVITPLAAEIFHRLVDLPSQWLSYKFFDFLRN